jgi:ribulose-phosphate 3-epimerase
MTQSTTVSRPRLRLSAGVNTADWTRLGEDLEVLRGTNCWAHVDVMDGQFCPALTGGPSMVKAVAACGYVVDAHLMVDEPRRFLPEVVAAGAGVVTVHAESTRHLHRTLQELTALAEGHPGLVRGVGLNPGTPVGVLDPVIELIDLVLLLAVNPGWGGQRPAANTARRVGEVRALAVAHEAQLLVELDGGVTLDNAAEVASWGADVVVSGSAIFDGKAPRHNLNQVLSSLGTQGPSTQGPSHETTPTATGEPR